MGYVPAVSGAAARSVQDHRPEVRGDMGCWEPAARHQVSVGRGAPRHRSGDFFRGGVAEPARDDAEAGRVWPFPSEDHIQATLTLVECLLTGRIELQVWKRPLGVKTRSYWINEDGQAELFLRGGTAGPYFGWSRTPEIYRFDYTRPGPFP